jgi:hypothetical protein
MNGKHDLSNTHRTKKRNGTLPGNKLVCRRTSSDPTKNKDPSGDGQNPIKK